MDSVPKARAAMAQADPARVYFGQPEQGGRGQDVRVQRAVLARG